MTVSKATLAMTAVAGLALGAGLAAGVLGNRLIGRSVVSSGGATGVETSGSSLSQELGLSSDQRDRMQQIWETVRDTGHDCQTKAQQLQKQRDDAVFAMLTDEQKAKYTQVTTECFGKIAQLNSTREAAFSKAVKETESILTDSQKKVYEQLIQARVGQHVSGGDENGPVQQVAWQK
jgi:hypothetical protein